MAKRSLAFDRRAERLRELQDATLQLIGEDGLEAFSMHRLAERVSLTPGALYRYFDSRDELLAAVQLEVLDGFDAHLSAVMGGLASSASPLERLVVLCRAYLSLRELQPERFRLIARLASSLDPLLDDEPARLALERAMALMGKLVDEIAGAQAAGLLSQGDAMRRAIVGWSSLQSIADRQKLVRLMPEQFEPRALFEELLRTLLLGWGAKASDVETALARGNEAPTTTRSRRKSATKGERHV